MCTWKLHWNELFVLMQSAFIGSLKTGASGENGEAPSATAKQCASNYFCSNSVLMIWKHHSMWRILHQWISVNYYVDISIYVGLHKYMVLLSAVHPFCKKCWSLWRFPRPLADDWLTRITWKLLLLQPPPPLLLWFFNWFSVPEYITLHKKLFRVAYS